MVWFWHTDNQTLQTINIINQPYRSTIIQQHCGKSTLFDIQLACGSEFTQIADSINSSVHKWFIYELNSKGASNTLNKTNTIITKTKNLIDTYSGKNELRLFILEAVRYTLNYEASLINNQDLWILGIQLLNGDNVSLGNSFELYEWQNGNYTIGEIAGLETYIKNDTHENQSIRIESSLKNQFWEIIWIWINKQQKDEGSCVQQSKDTFTIPTRNSCSINVYFADQLVTAGKYEINVTIYSSLEESVEKWKNNTLSLFFYVEDWQNEVQIDSVLKELFNK